MSDGAELEHQRPTAWVVGAGSGVGAAMVGELAERGYSVALSGRRVDRLEETIRQVQETATKQVRMAAHGLDVGDPDALESVHAAVVADLGPVEVLVFAAGLNTPRRYWADTDGEEAHQVYVTNLVAPTRLTSIVLPGMRELGRGSLLYVSSLSAWQHSPHAGVAYSASKKGLSTLPEHVNSTEGRFGVRATAIVPGDIDTEFLEMRPSIPDAEARKQMLSAQDVARMTALVLDQPQHVCVDELVITPVR